MLYIPKDCLWFADHPSEKFKAEDAFC